MTFMTFVTCMKWMKWMVHIHPQNECKCYVIVYFLLPHIITVFSYLRNKGCRNDSTVIAT